MEQSSNNPKTPDWATEPVQRLLSNVSQIHDFYHLTRDGLQMIIRHHEFLIRADERIDHLTAEVEKYGERVGRKKAEQAKRDETRRHAKEQADLALREVDCGFPVLHSQQVVFLWGVIEAVVEDTLVAWLQNERFIGKERGFRRIKVSVADFNAMSETERNYHIVSEYRRELRPRHRSTIEVFESILHEFGLHGAMGPELKRSLIELEYVRNVLLHRRGIVDLRFLEGCPWTTFKIGAAIVPDEKSVGKYTDAVLDYYELLLARIKRYFEPKPTKSDTATSP